VSFDTPPGVEVVRGDVDVNMGGSAYALAYPVFAETYVSRLLNRDEFRAHCDRYRTQSAILAHL
jgi:hypothetical protein